MSYEARENKLDKLIRILMGGLRLFCGIVLMLMMFLTAFDVAFRYLFNAPIEGTLEVVEYLMAILIPFSIAYCAFRKSHVAVDFVMGRFSRMIQRIVEFFVLTVTLAFVLVVTWQSVLYVAEVRESEVTSAVLLIATWPFVVPAALGMGIFGLVLFNHLVRIPRGEEI